MNETEIIVETYDGNRKYNLNDVYGMYISLYSITIIFDIYEVVFPSYIISDVIICDSEIGHITLDKSAPYYYSSGDINECINSIKKDNTSKYHMLRRETVMHL